MKGGTAPVLLIELGLEQCPRISISAPSPEDETLIQTWLRRTGATAALKIAVDAALDELDPRGRRQAA